ncbi:MAG: transposase [Firmicutes bacterium]|nr:transposase [Bacillota bacterium]
MKKRHEKIKRDDGSVRPSGLVTVDYAKLDCTIIDEKTNTVFGRPWVTLVIDIFSKHVTGYHISFEPPDALTPSTCLDQPLYSKYPNNECADSGMECQIEGATGNHVIIDKSESLMTDIQGNCINGISERLFNQINTKLQHLLYETSFANLCGNDEGSAEHHLCISYEMLDCLLRKAKFSDCFNYIDGGRN